MKSEKEIISYLTGYAIGEQIRKGLKAILGLFIMVMLWILPLWIFDLLGIGY